MMMETGRIQTRGRRGGEEWGHRGEERGTEEMVLLFDPTMSSPGSCGR